MSIAMRTLVEDSATSNDFVPGLETEDMEHSSSHSESCGCDTCNTHWVRQQLLSHYG
ncbi:hypothetical protein LLE49_16580 [Alicyclobacillus tolerans]|uniref:hypothetical protein n=1 Tax=Alicyclobacillus tolerans TaxID=90970 RepID=UPI001F2A5BC3|nr:hypothetical protein [Alicyclobacillus tolerans]MCF8566339.1 hypothetical protein [Alicyclobacillus tolerans]